MNAMETWASNNDDVSIESDGSVSTDGSNGSDDSGGSDDSEDMTGMEQWVSNQDDMVVEDDGSITNTETGVNTADDDTSNSDLDLIEGDGIGGDNSEDYNQDATDSFTENVAEDDDYGTSATSDDVAAAPTEDGGVDVVAASEEEVAEQIGASVDEVQQEVQDRLEDTEETIVNQSETLQQAQQMLRNAVGQEGEDGQSNGDQGGSPVLTVTLLLVAGGGAYWYLGRDE